MLLKHRRLALIEDDAIMGESLVQRLELEGANVAWWRSAEEARDGLGRDRMDAVICDIGLPDGTGEDIYREVASLGRHPPFLFITGISTVAQAVRLMRDGAHDYIAKPFEMNQFLASVQTLVTPANDATTGVLGVSASSRALEVFLRRAAPVRAPVLLTGETGVGKEVAARLLHALRAEPTGPFMAVNCAALPADLMESELFGHEKGAFTGAHGRHLGYAERAASGILFLDEIGDLPPKLQAKLLRLLEDRTFTRVGGERALPFEARLVCATNADLAARVAQGTFRDDLYYRINVLAVRIAALRERRDDIAWLMDRLFADLSRQMPTQAIGFSALAYAAAEGHDWPGNVRELRNRIERAVALATNHWIMPGDLFPERDDTTARAIADRMATLGEVRDEAERRQIARVLLLHDGQVQKTADALAVSRTTLWEKMKRFGIAANEPR
jgi:DNA-binding NtrC family response regulator